MRYGWSFASGAIISSSLLAFLSPAARADCDPGADRPPMCLSGTVLSKKFSAALLEPAGKHGLETVRKGGELLDWHVLEITPRSVLLGHDDRQIRLSLDDKHDTGEEDPDSAESVISPSESIAARSMRLRAQRAQQRLQMVVPIAR